MTISKPAHKSLETALDLAATIIAYARADLSELGSLQQRIEESLHDLVHEFCYHSRKAIERNAGGKRFISSLANIRVHPKPGSVVLHSDDPGVRVPLREESFWWIVNRVMHSVDFVVTSNVQSIDTVEPPFILSDVDVGGPRLISFRSDRDADCTPHYVDLEALVVTFVRDVAPLLVS